MSSPGSVLAEQSRPAWWKRTILWAITFGVSFAIAIVAVFGAVTWYKSRPRPWNASAITASYGTLEFSMPDEGFIVEFRYDLQNNTNHNYELQSANFVLMARLTEGGVLSKDFGHYQKGEASIDGPRFIPPKGKARVTIRVQYYYPYDSTAADRQDAKKVLQSVRRRLSELDGFVAFDNTNNFQIVMPRGWDPSTWDK